jgi:hypothetical protein
MNVKGNMAVSVCLECPVGVPSFFYMNHDNNGTYWDRNYNNKCVVRYTNFTEKVECFETVEQYLETDTFLNECAKELIFAKKIPVGHWIYFCN